jgi:hypothetical protein
MVALDASASGGFSTVETLPLALVVLVWIAVARTTFIQGDDMERPNRVAQLYGYAVCLIAVIVFLISANSLAENAFTLANPLRGGGNRFGPEPAISSFEAYRATANRENRLNPSASGTPTVSPPSDSVLRARYEVLRADRIDQVRFDAERSLTTSGLLLLLCVVLFVLHWRWLRPADPAAVDPGAAAPVV